MSNRSTYEGTIPVVNTALLVANATALAVYAATADAAKATYVAAGPSGFAAYDSSIKSAQRTLVAAQLKASHDAQQTIQVAKDLLRSFGDLAPA